jgi:hypothetical protein
MALAGEELAGADRGYVASASDAPFANKVEWKLRNLLARFHAA